MSVIVPDKDGNFDDVVLGFDTRAEYQQKANPHMGATVGRVCNRVNNGQFHMDGKLV